MSYNDVIRNVICVKCMCRVTSCKHDVVCNVNQCIDWTHTNLPDSTLHLIWCLFYIYTRHFYSDISWTSVWISNLYIKIRLYICLKWLDLS